jgi:cytoskeleton protein RodZ
MSRKHKRGDRPYRPHAIPQPEQGPPAREAETAIGQMLPGLDAEQRARRLALPPTATAPALQPGPTAEASAPSAPRAAPLAVEPSSPERDLFVGPGDARLALGARLRAAREAQGLSLDDVARASHVPSAVLADIEAGRTERLGAPIYLRGYLRTYARAVGVPEVLVQGAVGAEMAPPPLVATHAPSRSRYLANRYMPLVAYALLTVMVLVPFVITVRQGTSVRPVEVAQDLFPLDEVNGQITIPELRLPSTPDVGPPTPDAATAQAQAAPTALTGEVTMAAAEPAPERPMMASMAPLLEPDALAPAGVQRVRLELQQDSWVEFTGADGARIEYALLRAGTEREYRVAGRAELRIGNTRGAQVEIDGAAIDLTPFTRANVARLSVGKDIHGG